MKRRTAKHRNVFSSMGLVMPFEPSVWDDKSVWSVLSYAMEMVESKMKDRFSAESKGQVQARMGKYCQIKFQYSQERLVKPQKKL